MPLAALEAAAADHEQLYVVEEKRIRNKTRTLHKPRPHLKRIQQRINRAVFDRLVPHPAAACTRGRGAEWAARRHVGHPFLFRADIRHFYPSILPSRVQAGLERLGTPPDSVVLLVALTTVENQVPQGSPTSTAVGEMVLFGLDHRLGGLANRGIVYTRYADDITFSGGATLEHLVDAVKAIIVADGWELSSKGGLARREDPHDLLGYKVNAKMNIADSSVGAVRRMLRLAAKGTAHLNEKQILSIRGKLARLKHVNPARALPLESLLAKIAGQPGGRIS